jgi:8-oxo-dGTP pyrophosphatase MutT (NUDIX family)
VGDPSPWAHLTPEQRRISVAEVRAALADLPAPRSVSEHPFHTTAVAEARRVGVELRDAAVLLVVFEEDGEARLVLTRRPEHLPTHQGDVAFPGGKVDPAVDADAQAAALREAEEEIGLAPELVEVVAELDHLPSVGGAFAMAPFVGIVDGRPELTAAPGEVDRVFDVALSELLDPEVHHLERWNRFGPERVMYFFDVEGDTIWGATALVTAVFLGLVTGIDVVVN